MALCKPHVVHNYKKKHRCKDKINKSDRFFLYKKSKKKLSFDVFLRQPFCIKAVTFDEIKASWYFHLSILVSDCWWFLPTFLGTQYSWIYPKMSGSKSSEDFQPPTSDKAKNYFHTNAYRSTINLHPSFLLSAASVVSVPPHAPSTPHACR